MKLTRRQGFLEGRASDPRAVGVRFGACLCDSCCAVMPERMRVRQMRIKQILAKLNSPGVASVSAE